MSTQKIIKLLSEHIPADLSIKSLAKINPQLKSFFSAAAAAGYGLNEIQKYLRDLTSQAPGRDVRREELSKRRGQGGLRKAEVLEQAKLEDQERQTPRIPTGLLAAGAGLSASGLAGSNLRGSTEQESVAPEGEQQQVAEPAQESRQQSFFQKALEGVDFFDLSDNVKSNVGKLGKRLDALEQQGSPWKDRSVQKVVRALRKLTGGGGGLVDQELSRFDQTASPQQAQQQSQQPQGSDSDAQFMALLDDFSSRFLK